MKSADDIDWQQISETLDREGWAGLEGLLTATECHATAALYDRDDGFRSKVVMARHGFGRGEYKYFSYPLPPRMAELRETLYPDLGPIANRWNEAMKIETRFPPTHRAFLKRCHDAGQARPTPLLLRYGPGDYNCLHQDLYGKHVFPLQVEILLSEPENYFTGGEFVLTEQRPPMQSRNPRGPRRTAKNDAEWRRARASNVRKTRDSARVRLRLASGI